MNENSEMLRAATVAVALWTGLLIMGATIVSCSGCEVHHEHYHQWRKEPRKPQVEVTVPSDGSKTPPPPVRDRRR